MSYSIIVHNAFERELKYLFKKYPSIKADVAKLGEMLAEDPIQGTPLGNDCYKIRMAITSKGRGKSAGARIITHIKIINEQVYLLSIYDKSEAENITDSEIQKRLATLEMKIK
jgi:mRNA-degrading endonuclease RelE of RelBE toxin-antitoxin system